MRKTLLRINLDCIFKFPNHTEKSSQKAAKTVENDDMGTIGAQAYFCLNVFVINLV